MSSNNAPSAASNDRLVASSQAEENEGCYVRSRRRNRDAKVPGKAQNFRKKSQKILAFRKMAAVTVIRLSVYIGIPPCTALTCRRRTKGVENMK